MQKLGDVRRALDAGELNEALSHLLYDDLAAARQRIANVLEQFQQSFGAGDDTLVALCSAPAALRLAATIPTISTAVFWPVQLIWTFWPVPVRTAPIPSVSSPKAGRW